MVAAAPKKPAKAPAKKAAPKAVEPTLKHHSASTGKIFTTYSLALHLGIDRSVVERWVKKNRCPVHREGTGRGAGKETELDIVQVFKWHTEFVRRQVLEEVGASDGGDVKADTELLKLAQAASLVMMVADVRALHDRVYGEFRQTVMSISDQVSRSMTGLPKAKVDDWCDRVNGIMRDALSKMHSDFDESYVEPSIFVTVEDGADRP